MATNFEGFSHQQLLAMVASLDPETVTARSTLLTEAAKTIEEIGKALKKHKVKGWEGEAATKFEEWADRTGNATLALSDYSAAGGKWMGEAAQIMHEVKKNIPAYDSSTAETYEAARKYHNDPDAQKLASESHAKLSGDHQKAIDALTKLAGAYEQSNTQIGKVEPPTFPPPPGDFVPDYGVYGSEDIQRSGGGYGAGSGGGSGSYAPSTPRTSGPSNDLGGVGGHRPEVTLPPTTGPAPVPVLPDHDVDVDLDHVGTLPDRTVPPVTNMPNLPGPGPSGPGPVAPMPPIGLPSLPGPTLPGGGGPVSKLPPLTGPGGKFGGPAPLLPRDTGIIGGRQVTTGGPTPGLPRSTVIGTEGVQGGRGMGGSGMHPGVGGPHGGGPGGGAAGRRLAMEPGGVVGGRQPGVVGRPVAGGQPFTQGGSGLVRNTSASGAGRGTMGVAGAGGHTPGNRHAQRTGDRPDYLSEDEETWQGNGRVVPPVID
ncbi:hypothetical protein AB0953_29135 [Streptomyces sp. NPDC046866]|uniref:WXG100 family type VII secretion target n=1 Tax=Streptomyces sp. NPDC046866 TaxID=3154921 RepID=UPI0034542EB7